MNRLPLRLLVGLPVIAGFSFLALMIPVWSDWQTELERSQRAALQVSAQGIARMLAEDDRYLRFLEDEVAEITYRAAPLHGSVVLDGRRLDWGEHPQLLLGLDHLLEMNEPYTKTSLEAALSVGADNDFLYIHLAVVDDFVVYRGLNAISVHRNDHVQIALVDHEGIYRRYTVSVLQPGEISVAEVGASGRALRDVDAIAGRWLATEAGYNVELRIPRQIAQRRFSIVVGDVDDETSRHIRYVVGLSATRSVEALGTLIYSPTELERVLGKLPYAVRVISQGGVTLSSEGFDYISPAVVAVQPIQMGSFESGTLTLKQLIAPSSALTSAFRFQTVVVFIASFVLMCLATSLLWWMLQRRLNEVRNEIQRHIDSRSSENVSLTGDDFIDQFGVEIIDQLNRTHEHNEYLERMASRLNHELRTPVSVVKSSLENLQVQQKDEDAQVYVDRAIQGVERLTNILNKMGEARRLEEALDEDEVTPFDLITVVSGCVAGYELAYSQQRFEFKAEVDEAPVTGIPELIAQLLDKLIENAVEFSTGEIIKLRLHRESDEILLRVMNEGAELPVDESSEGLFASMVSVRETSKETHLGLGLYVARMIARFHGGDLSITNREDARGVMVTLRLPLLRLTAKLAGSRS